jgi:hypothetical protein
VSFTDVAGSTSSWPSSPHQGSLITGQVFNGTTWAYYLRHVQNVTFAACSTTPAASDARQALGTADATGISGAP